MDRTKYLLKNVGLLTISNFSTKILVFLLVPLYTSVLTTSEYGIYDLIISTVSLLYPIFTLNISDAVMRFTMDNRYKNESVITLGFKYISISAIITAIVAYVLSLLGIWEGLRIYFLLYYIFYVFNQFFTQMAKGLEKIFEMAVSGVLSTLVMVIGNIVFLLFFECGLNGFFLAVILSQALPTVYLCISMKVWHYVNFGEQDKKVTKTMLNYSVPLIATTLGWWVNNSLDKYEVTLLCGVAANGLLSVSYKIPSILNVVQQIFIQAWQISAIKEYEEHESRNFYGKTFTTINMMMCASCAVLILLTRPLASILYAKEFYVAWEFVPFLLISSVLNCAAGLLGPILSAKQDTKTMMWSAIFGACVNAVLNFILIICIGIQGATIATLISSSVIFYIRRRGVGQDILIEDRYWINWILLILQACIEVTIGNYIVELIIIVFLIVVNIRIIRDVLQKGMKMLKH